MKIKTNQELAQFVKKAIKESGMKKTDLAENIGLSRQGLDNLLNKKSFSVDDANRILNSIGVSISTKIVAENIIPSMFISHKLLKFLDLE